MTDLSPDFDFTAAANEAIAAAEPVEEPAVEEAAEEATPVGEDAAAEEQPRAADGKFASKTTAVEDEVEALRKRLADKDEFISRQGNELGDLRKTLEERFDTLEQRTTQTRYSADSIVDAETAAAVTQAAWASGDQVTAAHAYREWKEYDPASAGAWAGYVAAKQEAETLYAQQAQEIEALKQQFAPISQATVEQQRTIEVRNLAAEIPTDQLSAFLESEQFLQLAGEHGMEADLADPSKTVNAIKTLFYVHRGRTADTLNQTVQDVARATAEQAEQATADAYVASAATATATTTVEKTEEQQIADSLAARFTRRSSVWNDAWERG